MSSNPITLNETVYAINNEDHPVEFMWNSRRFVLEPGRKQPISLDSAINHLGDPRSGAVVQTYQTDGGETGFIPDRAAEVRRLRARYGNSLSDESSVIGFPSVSILDLDDNPIPMVVDDPSGEGLSSAAPKEPGVKDLTFLVEQQQEQINRLLKLVGGDAGEPVSEDQLPEDDEKTDFAVADESFFSGGSDATSDPSDAELPSDE